MDHYLKYKFYKAKYKAKDKGKDKGKDKQLTKFGSIELGGGQNYREAYLQAIKDKDCPQIEKLENLFKKLYYDTRGNSLIDRYLYVYPKDFGGKCGDFWSLLPDPDNTGWRQAAAGRNKASITSPLPQRLFLYDSIFLTSVDQQLIRENRALLFQNNHLPNLFCLFFDRANNFFYLLYLETWSGTTYKQSVSIAYKDYNSVKLPEDPRLFQIKKDLDNSRINEAHIGSYFYYDPVSSGLRNQIIELLHQMPESKFPHWTNWLLTAILNVLFTCLKCTKIHLQDVSEFDRLKREGKMECGYYTIIYQTAKNRPGFYQSVGFRADPPIDTDNLKDIMSLKSKPHSRPLPNKQHFIYLKRIDPNGRSYYQNITNRQVVWDVYTGIMIESRLDLITITNITAYLNQIEIDSKSYSSKLSLLTDISQLDTKTGNQVVTLTAFRDWLLDHHLPIRISNFNLSRAQLTKLENLLLDKGICPKCGNPIDKHTLLKPGTLVSIQNSGPHLNNKLATVIKLLGGRPDDTSFNNYQLQLLDPQLHQSPTLTIKRSDIQPRECQGCVKTGSSLFFSKIELNKYNFISFVEIQRYVKEFIKDWKSQQQYYHTPTDLEKHLEIVEEKLQAFSNKMGFTIGSTHQLLFHLRDFVEWHGTTFYQESRTQEADVPPLKGQVAARVLADPIKSNLLTPIIGRGAMTNLQHLIRNDCVCPNCYRINPSSVERLISKLQGANDSHSRLTILQELQPHITQINHILKKTRSFKSFNKRYQPDWKHLQGATDITLTSLNRWLVVTAISHKQNKQNKQNKENKATICLLPRYLNLKLLDPDRQRRWCVISPCIGQKGWCGICPCIECNHPLTGLPPDSPLIPIIDNRPHRNKAITTGRFTDPDTGERTPMYTLPQQPDLQLGDMVEIGDIQDRDGERVLIYYPVTIIDSRQIPKQITNPFHQSTEGANTNLPVPGTSQTVTEYLVQFLDQDQPQWTLLTEKTWRLCGIDWKFRLDTLTKLSNRIGVLEHHYFSKTQTGSPYQRICRLERQAMDGYIWFQKPMEERLQHLEKLIS